MTEVITVLNSIGYTDITEVGGIYRMKPIYRESDNNTVLCVKKSTGQYFDHAERVGGWLAQLVQRTLKLASTSDSKQYLGDIPLTFDNKESTELTETKHFDKSILVKLIHDNSYWNTRGIGDFTLQPFLGGLAQQGRMKGRYVFPIFENKDDLVGFAGRWPNKCDKNMIPWKLLGKKTNWVYPYIAFPYIMEEKQVILVESIANMLSLWEIGIKNSIVLFGCVMSPAILTTLLKYDVSKIFLLLDNDKENGWVGNQAAEEIQKDLLSFFDKEQVVNITPPKKDLNEMLQESLPEFQKFCENVLV
jgi:hypothetical protein